MTNIGGSARSTRRLNQTRPSPTRPTRTRIGPARLLLLTVLAIVGTSASVAAFGAAPAGADTVDVSITDTGFGPPTVAVAKGSTVVWSNDGTTTHDVTADDNSFQSGPMSPGQSFTFTFDTEGTYTYRSTADANYNGAIVVTGAAVGSAQSVDPATTPAATPAAPTTPVATPGAMAFTGAAQSIGLAVVGTVALLFGWAIITGMGGAGSPLGGIEPWRILALADPRRLGFTDELLPRGRWRREPRRSRQADLLPGSGAASHTTATAAPTTRAPAENPTGRRARGRPANRRGTRRRSRSAPTSRRDRRTRG